MKLVRKKSDIEMALLAYQLNQRINEDTKELKKLKEYFKEAQSEGHIKCGEILIKIEIKQIERVMPKADLIKKLGDKAKELFKTKPETRIKFDKVA